MDIVVAAGFAVTFFHLAFFQAVLFQVTVIHFISGDF
jgi:hypothetical protein|tara:strand:+ start:1283 stop:1393 length:111 start_codon:yes stop_codon:yes gene_type:complete